MEEKETDKTLTDICRDAKAAASAISLLNPIKKKSLLLTAASALERDRDLIIRENQSDMERAEANNMPDGLKDRLYLDEKRIKSMADGLREVADLPDPVGEVIDTIIRPNGLKIEQVRVPIGVIGVIYEARPNVTADVFGLCMKTGNAVILKGGSAAANSNKAIIESLKKALKKEDLPEGAAGLITDNRHEITRQFMKMRDYVDLLIPRGGAGLIKSVVENSTIPVIETGTGNCHVYVDDPCDMDMALDIIENAKTQRIGVCNACESLVINRSIEKEFLPLLSKRLSPYHVELRCDSDAGKYLDNATKATDEDFGREYLDYILSVKSVDNVDEAISHINKYNTGHSETIVTTDYNHAEKFLNLVDSACVYVNASTRFTDGHEFGFGAEIGISTQKIHARGPMGLKALTSTKYKIYGNGQIRK